MAATAAIQARIQREIDRHGGVLPEQVALVWHGYLAALIEWGLITPAAHGQLVDMLPEVADNPVIRIFLEPD